MMLFMLGATAQDQKNENSIKITIEVNEDGKTTKKVKEFDLNSLEQPEELEDALKGIKNLEDIDVQINDDDVELFIIRKGSEHPKMHWEQNQHAFL